MAANDLPEPFVVLEAIASYGDGSRWVAFTAEGGASITAECRVGDLRSFGAIRRVVARVEGVTIANTDYLDAHKWAMAKNAAHVRGRQHWN